MNKKLFIFAIAALGLAACSNDEVVETQATSEANAITFRPLTNGVTRAADITTADNLTSFMVTAFRNTSPSPTFYFAGVKFTGPGTYTSSPKYYWPTENVNFYAWSAHSSVYDASSQVTGTYNALVVTPSTDAATQADLVYASSENVAKAASVPLTFSHKESRIVLKIKNTSANITFSVTGWRLGYMAPSGTFNGSTWTPTTADADKVYTSDFDAVSVGAEGSATMSEAQIMIPQAVTPVTAYASTATDAKVDGAYIAVQYTAKNSLTNDDIVGSATWAIWKIPAITWLAGTQYTYTIDLADGGYYETNQASTTEALDPIFENAFIKFASVTVSAWTLYDGDGNGSADADGDGNNDNDPIDVSM